MPRPQFSLLMAKALLAITSGAATCFLVTGVFFGSKPLLVACVVTIECWFIVVYSGTLIARQPFKPTMPQPQLNLKTTLWLVAAAACCVAPAPAAIELVRSSSWEMGATCAVCALLFLLIGVFLSILAKA